MLATEATALIHGREKAEAAAETARKTFEQGTLATDLPTIEIQRGDLEAGLGVLTAFVKAGLVASNSEARRQIQGGGLKVNDETVTSDKAVLKAADAADERRHQAIARQKEARAFEARLKRAAKPGSQCGGGDVVDDQPSTASACAPAGFFDFAFDFDLALDLTS